MHPIPSSLAVSKTPPSFDGHRETTFAMIHPIAPHYSTLLRFDPKLRLP
jgi:peptide/nickel transport system substrate-binding protein